MLPEIQKTITSIEKELARRRSTLYALNSLTKIKLTSLHIILLTEHIVIIVRMIKDPQTQF